MDKKQRTPKQVLVDAKRQVRKSKRLQISTLLSRAAVRESLNNYKISLKTGLTATQVKDILDRDSNYTVESLIAVLEAIDVDLVDAIDAAVIKMEKRKLQL